MKPMFDRNPKTAIVAYGMSAACGGPGGGSRPVAEAMKRVKTGADNLYMAFMFVDNVLKRIGNVCFFWGRSSYGYKGRSFVAGNRLFSDVVRPFSAVALLSDMEDEKENEPSSRRLIFITLNLIP